jgi:phosphinothricin acetyltransferase
VIERATTEHAAAIAALYAPYVTDSAISFETVPPDAAVMSRRISDSVSWLVSTRDGEVTGFASATNHRARAAYRWAVDCSVDLRPEEQGRGTSKLIYGRLFDELRALGYVQAFAGIALPNPASVGAHESMGFEPIGVYRQVGFKLGRWHDVGWWQLTLTPPPEAPAEPLA